MKYDRFFSEISKARKPSAIRETTKLLVNASPSLVNLGAGFPNPNLFPFKSATFTLQNGQELKLNSNSMKGALQYGPSLGYPPLIDKLKSLAYKLHKPPNWSNTDLLVTTGGQDGLAKAIEMIINPGDYFVTQEPVYTGTLAIIDPLNPKYITVEVDEYGMKPDVLLRKLDSERKHPRSPNVPKVLYINPTAGNPCGTSLTINRKREIYKIACEYDLIILEDDPYYLVHFDEESCPTFLSLDIEGRVLRFDSFSKVLSSGIRIGYVTGPKELIYRICLHTQSSVLHAAGISQVMVNDLLHEWGDELFMQHVDEVKKFYLKQRNLMLIAADKHLKDICRWNVPAGGMFLWLEVIDLEDTYDMIMNHGVENNVILLPGKVFLVDPNAKSKYLRASYSSSTAEQMDRGFRYLSKMIKDEMIVQNKK